MNSVTIRELGENRALELALAHLKPGQFEKVGPGDDAAVLQSSGSLVVTTDTMVEDHDFRTHWSSGFDLGWKAVATNLADVAAMGATPTALVAALVVRQDTQIFWLEEFAKGMQAAIDELSAGCAVVGGDLALGENLVIAITAHGELHRDPVLRSGAKPGDRIALAGTLGKAAAGLSLLEFATETLIESYQDLVSIQLKPRPPISLGVTANNAGATSMLDVSDGLAKDAGRIARASGVTMALSSAALEGYFAVLEQAAQSINSRGGKANEKDWVLFGGEDHPLLATFPNNAEVPKGFKVIGEVLPKSENFVTLNSLPLSEKGWDSVAD